MPISKSSWSRRIASSESFFLIIHERLVPGEGEPEKETVGAVVKEAVVNEAGASESVAGDSCGRRSTLREIVTLVPTRRGRKWALNPRQVIVVSASRGDESKMWAEVNQGSLRG